jgi:hypothetical protein
VRMCVRARWLRRKGVEARYKARMFCGPSRVHALLEYQKSRGTRLVIFTALEPCTGREPCSYESCTFFYHIRICRLNLTMSHASTLLHKIPDMHYIKHKPVKNTLPSHHVKHDDTRVPPNCRRAEKQALSRHPGWLNLSLKRVLLSVEFVELSP